MLRNPKLTLLNSESLCQRLITRSPSVNQKIENSVIDFILVCEKVLPFVNKFIIDEQKIYSLANYSSKLKITYSDHNSLITEINFKYENIKPERRLIFNFKDPEGLQKFKFMTNIPGRFSNIFNSRLSFKKQVKLWNNKLQYVVKNCFKKVRLRKTKKFSCKKFKDEKNAITNHNKYMKTKAETELSKEDAENNLTKLRSNINQLNDKRNGNQNNIWKVKNKFFPKIQSAVPIAKRNLENKIITHPVELKKVYVKHFQHRMRKRPILSKFKDYENKIENKFSEILDLISKNQFPDWTLANLEKVLNSLKKSQSQDSMGLVNELFMQSNIGEDLKISLLIFFNHIKNLNQIPDFF